MMTRESHRYQMPADCHKFSATNGGKSSGRLNAELAKAAEETLGDPVGQRHGFPHPLIMDPERSGVRGRYRLDRVASATMPCSASFAPSAF